MYFYLNVEFNIKQNISMKKKKMFEKLKNRRLYSSNIIKNNQTKGSVVFLAGSISPSNLLQTLIDFYHIWPWHQWLLSLTSLILLYWVTGHFYNKWLSDRGGWLDFKLRVWLIISDLVMNLALGLYYMHHRDTIMGNIMVRCPIAISPVIFILEIICVYIYYRFWTKK